MPDFPDQEFAAMLARAAVAAGAAVMEIYSGGFTVEQKADRTPVTEADARAEEIILAHLARERGDIAVVSEEACAEGAALPDPAPERFFLVDPLDGTREFISRNGEFTINIALIERGRPVAGVVLAPVPGRMFIADGTAAYVADARSDDAADPSNWRPIAARTPPRGELVALVSRSHGDPETQAYLAGIGVTSTAPAGSSLKFCLLAAGEADVYPRFGRTMEWDTAAGQAVLERAGGSVETLDGAPLAYGKADMGYANPSFIARGLRSA